MAELTHLYRCLKCGFQQEMEPVGSLDVRYILKSHCRECKRKRDWYIVPKPEPPESH